MSEEGAEDNLPSDRYANGGHRIKLCKTLELISFGTISCILILLQLIAILSSHEAMHWDRSMISTPALGSTVSVLRGANIQLYKMLWIFWVVIERLSEYKILIVLQHSHSITKWVQIAYCKVVYLSDLIYIVNCWFGPLADRKIVGTMATFVWIFFRGYYCELNSCAWLPLSTLTGMTGITEYVIMLPSGLDARTTASRVKRLYLTVTFLETLKYSRKSPQAGQLDNENITCLTTLLYPTIPVHI